MSIIIEQDEETFRSASEFSTHAELDRVTLLDASLKKAVDTSSLSRPLELRIHYEPGLAAVKSGCANLQIRFEFRATDASGDAPDVIALACTLEASYSLEKDYKPGSNAIDAFHRANAVFNSWPFFREYVQSTVVRMNMPAPPVPLLRLLVTPKESPKAAPHGEEKGKISPSRRRRQARPSK